LLSRRFRENQKNTMFLSQKISKFSEKLLKIPKIRNISSKSLKISTFEVKKIENNKF